MEGQWDRQKGKARPDQARKLRKWAKVNVEFHGDAFGPKQLSTFYERLATLMAEQGICNLGCRHP